MEFTPDRQSGLARLASFAPFAGRPYQSTRNADHGPGRNNVSQLSPWLHAGLVTERDVLDTLRSTPEAGDTYKFTSEVFWRLYFKGHLEQHPSIWRSYRADRDAAMSRLDGAGAEQQRYEAAMRGETGIEAFDYWARELVETGFLHNHARMWFASIWIFTLNLDWTLGADFFLRHLMDGDAASNTLNWRWVAGLHTKGKPYLARPGNISRYTADHPDGPFTAEGLAPRAEALSEDTAHPRQPFAFEAKTFPDAPYALLLHDEGASHEVLDLPCPPALVIGASRPLARSPGPVGSHADAFATAAVANGVAAAATAFGCPSMLWDVDDALGGLLAQKEVGALVLPYLPVGWTRDALQPGLGDLAETMPTVPLLDTLQQACWPLATAGFYRVRKAIPDILAKAGIA